MPDGRKDIWPLVDDTQGLCESIVIYRNERIQRGIRRGEMMLGEPALSMAFNDFGLLNVMVAMP